MGRLFICLDLLVKVLMFLIEALNLILLEEADQLKSLKEEVKVQ